FWERTVARVYERYQAKLQENGAFDFDDLIFAVVRLFQEDPAVLEQYQERFRYLMVDEYQDTNHAQYVLVNLLAGGHRNLCVWATRTRAFTGFGARTSATSWTSNGTTPTRRSSSWSKTTARRSASWPRPTRSSPTTWTARKRTCGPATRPATRCSFSRPATSGKRRLLWATRSAGGSWRKGGPTGTSRSFTAPTRKAVPLKR